MSRLTNLPPGCSESDIPGNRPEDVRWERYLQHVEDALADLGLEVCDLTEAEYDHVQSRIEHWSEFCCDEDGYGDADRVAAIVLEEWRERQDVAIDSINREVQS